MPYFLPLQRKKVINNLNLLTSHTKQLEYLKNQKRITKREIKCLKQVVRHPFTYKNLLKDKYRDMILVLHSYSTFVDEKIDFRIPKAILIFRPLIKILIQGRYIWKIKKEKIKLWNFLLEKEREVKNELHIDGQQIEFDFEKPFGKQENRKEEIFEIPDKKEILKIKTLTNFDLDKLVQGYKWISNLTLNMKDRDKVIALNDIKNDLKEL